MPFLLIVLACMIVLSAYLNTPKGKGRLGEFRVRMILGKTKVIIKRRQKSLRFIAVLRKFILQENILL